MYRRAFAVVLCLFAGTDLWAGDEYPARPGEQVVANELIVRLRSGSTAASLIAGYLPGAQVQALGRERLFRISVPGGIRNGVSTQLAADLQVEYVEPNRVRHMLLAAPNDPSYPSSWWFQNVQAAQAWNLLPGQYLTAATAGTGRVKVAVLDTGADCTHPDFINTGGSSTDSALGGQLMFSASQAFVATTIGSPTCAWQDDQGHGTHVTGILAAATSNAVGVSGLAFPVQVIEYKVLDSTGSGSDVNIANAIMAAADAGAQVVSLSLGGAGYSQTLQTAVNYAWQRNTLVVAAAGNSATSSLFFPAGANHAIGVSATDSGNNLASFSNFGNSVHLAAPGVGILSTAPTYAVSSGWSNYVSLSGTSMATPFVSALAGLVAMSTPNATAQSILQRMEQTASSITAGGGWNQNFGFGVINASSAVSGAFRTASNGAMAGQIVNSAGNPVGGAQITINGQTITADSWGLYRAGTLPAGTYPVTVSATGFPTQSLSATVAPGADTPFTVAMGVTYGKFTGTVTDQGLGVAGAIVQALSNGLINAVAVADLAGQYTLWVPGGTYDLRASAIGRNTTTVSALSVPAGGTTSANVILPRMGTIAGSVRDGNLNPVANAQVLVTGGSFSAAATTDGSGNYSLIAVPNGSQYSVTATAAGFPASTQNGIAVSTGVVTSVSFTVGSLSVATPTFAPAGGTYSSPQSVTISTTTAGASIRYTTDGSTPTSAVGIVYGGPVSVSSSLTLKAVAYKTGMTDSAVTSASYVITVGGSSNTASFVKTDATTQGTWKGVYGAHGYNVIDDTVSYPAYVTVAPAGQSDYIWAGSTSDVRALQKALASDRIAATWYTSGSFTVDLNFNDGAQHQLAVFCLDFDSAGARTQTISILDGVTNAVLNSQNVNSFQNGKYLVWNLTGHVLLRVTNTGSLNATISGLFFDPASSGSTAATPTFAPPGGNYSSTQSVTITGPFF
ncbi:MAG: alkaline serine protease [Bryobacterales bacterium]|nr:alkaline serine protease [Bryobacterales bacterium]